MLSSYLIDILVKTFLSPNNNEEETGCSGIPASR